MNVYIADTETTGLAKQQPIEICYFDLGEIELLRQLKPADLAWFIADFSGYYLERFKPSIPITEHASKVNNIYMKDLLKCRKTSEYILPEIDYLIAHQAIFDYNTLFFDGCHPDTLAKKPNVKLICTKELAQIAFAGSKGLKNNKLVTLIEYLYPEHYEKFTTSAHTALTDCKMVYLLLLKILEKMPNVKSWEDLASYCNQPKDKGQTYEEMNKTVEILEICNVGKVHKGKRFCDIPLDYLSWLVAQDWASPTLKATCNYHLNEKKL